MRERRESVRSRPWRCLPRNGGTLRYAIVVAVADAAAAGVVALVVAVADAAVISLVVALTATAATDLKCDATCSTALRCNAPTASQGE